MYRCSACNRPLFLEVHRVCHGERAVADVPFRRGQRWTPTCEPYFVQKLAWMGDLTEDEGLIHCPGCGAKLGGYKWSGRACTCGKLVVPYLALYPTKVDRVMVPVAPTAQHT